MESDWKTVGEKRNSTAQAITQSSNGNGRQNYVPPHLRKKVEPTYESMFSHTLGSSSTNIISPPQPSKSPQVVPLIMSIIKGNVAKEESLRKIAEEKAKAVAANIPQNDYEAESRYILQTGITRCCASIPARSMAQAVARRNREELEEYYAICGHLPQQIPDPFKEDQSDRADYDEFYSDLTDDDSQEEELGNEDDGFTGTDKYGRY